MEIKKAVKYRVVCPHCGSVIKFKLNEVEFDDSCADFGGYIKCSCCGRKIQTHDGYWTKKEFYLSGSVVVIYEGEEDFLHGGEMCEQQ